MQLNKNNRGFKNGDFIDRNGEKCSIQKSSIATEHCLWLGIDNPIPKVCVFGKGWEDIPLPPETLLSGRMHLTQNMVKDLLPLLIKFAETGEI